MASFDVIIVGGGVMGCAAAAFLSRRRAKVLLLEAGRIGGTQGSSHGRSRIIRMAYGAPHYIDLCRAAYRSWRALEDEAGELLFYVTGGVDIATPGIGTWDRARSAMIDSGVAFEQLDHDEMRRRFPQFRAPESAQVLFQPDAGVLHADACLSALSAVARRNGARLEEGVTVTVVDATRHDVRVTTEAGTFRADSLVLAAGARMPQLLAMTGSSLPLTVSIEQVAYFRPHDTASFTAGRFPLFIVHFADGRLGSGFPLIRDPGLKLMLEHKRSAAPGSLQRDAGSADPERIEALRRHALQYLPGLTGEILGSATCRYTLTPDEDFVLDRNPDNPRVVVASACSGHGFKFGALFGEALADLALGLQPAIDLSRFQMSRFAPRAASSSTRA
jgi:monomeric sarcosine oxidase